ELVAIADAIANGSLFKCRKCYNTERHLQSKYKKEGKAHIWRGMDTQARRAEIKKHNGSSEGQGKRREYTIKESTNVTDKMGFEKYGRETWGWTPQVASEKWTEAMSPPLVQKGTDEEGWPTVAKFSTHSLTSGRELSHTRGITSSGQTEAHAHELRSVAQDVLEGGELHTKTGVFDNMALPTLPGFARLAIQPSKKARSKPKTKKTEKPPPPPLPSHIKPEPSESDDGSKVRKCLHELKIAETERKWVAAIEEQAPVTSTSLQAAAPLPDLALSAGLLDTFVGLASMLPPSCREGCIPRLELTKGLETLSAAVEDRIREMSPRRAAMTHAAFDVKGDPDGTQGGNQALKWWERDCESRLKALKKAEAGVAREAKKIRDKENRDKLAEQKRAKAKSLAAAKAIEAPPDGGEPITGLNAWVLYAQGETGAMKPIEFREGADWCSDG
ncbi:unnamed protein product, partial [Symbiodinium sp. CCMP2592]